MMESGTGREDNGTTHRVTGHVANMNAGPQTRDESEESREWARRARNRTGESKKRQSQREDRARRPRTYRLTA